MKRVLVSFIFVIFAIISCFSAASTAKVDLQPRDVFYATLADQGQNGGLQPGFYVNIQNNGPEDFQGKFKIAYSYDGMQGQESFVTFSGSIRSGSYMSARLSPEESIYFVKIDSENEVNEENETNNNSYLEVGDSQVRIISSWTGVIAEDYYPIMYVLPNEYFFQQFSLSELSSQKIADAEGSIIGFSYSSNAFDFPGSEQYYSDVQSHWPEGTYVDGNLIGGKYSFYLNPEVDKYHASCKWMANSSSAAIKYFWLGSFQGTTKGMAIGSEAKIFINAEIALRDLTRKSDGLSKTIKVIDRIRGDVNDDGVVDQKDLSILTDVVDNGLYNPCMTYRNMYQERGINYGAGIIMFENPDFLSNCLFNIWINDKNDPLVQGLGIGELMSKTAQNNYDSPVYGVKNSFSVSDDNLIINAPEADLYNVTAQVEGKLFQSTGKITEKVKLPINATNVRVETVKVRQNLTALTTPKNDLDVLIYPTKISDYCNVKYLGNGKVQVINLAGQILFSAPLKSNEELRIETGSWLNGVYLVNITSASGKVSKRIIK